MRAAIETVAADMIAMLAGIAAAIADMIATPAVISKAAVGTIDMHEAIEADIAGILDMPVTIGAEKMVMAATRSDNTGAIADTTVTREAIVADNEGTAV